MCMLHVGFRSLGSGEGGGELLRLLLTCIAGMKRAQHHSSAANQLHAAILIPRHSLCNDMVYPSECIWTCKQPTQCVWEHMFVADEAAMACITLSHCPKL